MSPTKTLKVRVALLCILVGTVLALVGVVTDHWAVLSPHVEHHNTTCEAAHFGLWRICTKRIFVGDKERSCGPITLPGGNVPAPPGPVGGRGSPDRIRAAPAAPGAVGQPRAWAGAVGRPRWGWRRRSRPARRRRSSPAIPALGLRAGQGQGSGWADRPRLRKENADLQTQPGRTPQPNAALRWKGRLGGSSFQAEVGTHS